MSWGGRAGRAGRAERFRPVGNNASGSWHALDKGETEASLSVQPVSPHSCRPGHANPPLRSGSAGEAVFRGRRASRGATRPCAPSGICSATLCISTVPRPAPPLHAPQHPAHELDPPLEREHAPLRALSARDVVPEHAERHLAHLPRCLACTSLPALPLIPRSQQNPRTPPRLALGRPYLPPKLGPRGCLPGKDVQHREHVGCCGAGGPRGRGEEEGVQDGKEEGDERARGGGGEAEERGKVWEGEFLGEGE